MLQVVRDVVAILGVIIAFSYYIIILRNQNTSRNAQMFMIYHDKINSEPLRSKYENIMSWNWDDYNDFEEKYGKRIKAQDSTARARDNYTYLIADLGSPLWNLLDILFFFESLGVLSTKSHLDIEMVSRLASRISPVWSKYGEIIYEWRKQNKEEMWDAYTEFEDLYLNVREYWKTQTVVTNMVATFKSRRQKLGLPTY